VIESGYPDYQVGVWFGLAGSSKLPDEVVTKVMASMDKALGDATFRASLEKIGFPVLKPKTVAEINQFVDEDRARWSKVIKAMNISLD
jgi:tripartite-type tricarboxylate transporter receptor subunit TctC